MKTYDFDAVIFDSAVYCCECCPHDIDDIDAVTPIFADSEWDCLPVCEKCGTTHDYVSLTREGVLNELAHDGLEVFFMPLEEQTPDTYFIDETGEPLGAGWFYWFCSPGCLPDSEPYGPFKTEQNAFDDAIKQFHSSR